MGLFDRLRGKDRDDDDTPASGPVDLAALGPEVPDPAGFAPRWDGSYHAGTSTLTFVGGGRVVEQADGARRTGEWTSAGRFLVTAPLEPAVTFTVTGTTEDGFTARRTTVVDRVTTELTYRFEPSTPADG